MKVILIVSIVCFAFCSASAADNKPGLLLAANYQPSLQLKNYWVSEKLDGVRAYWDGRQLLSRQGNRFNAPEWFTKQLPNIALDGELWIARSSFDEVSAKVRTKSNNKAGWKNIKYMVFDLPASKQRFTKRLQQLQTIIQSLHAKHIQAVRQYKVASHKALMQKLDDTVKSGGEGLMLHSGRSYYKSGRNNDLLKLKKYSDAEAVVIQHLPGKGKYKGMLGSIVVQMPDQKQFKIGTGFSDQQRKQPPAIGSVITYKHFGKTSNGIPRFASFLRIRTMH
ncbi:MAG: DNA ligase [Gammaproteobacteria bacterium]|nr:DNA ligase [Gammaproteobacteria bacterium]